MFYDQFIQLCNEKGVSPSRVALINKVSKTSVTRWKNGATPNADILKTLATYFNVTTDYLLGNTDIKNKPTTSKDDEPSYKSSPEYLHLMNVFDKLTPENQQRVLDIAELEFARQMKKQQK